jgi:hypothetical protein
MRSKGKLHLWNIAHGTGRLTAVYSKSAINNKPLKTNTVRDSVNED